MEEETKAISEVPVTKVVEVVDHKDDIIKVRLFISVYQCFKVRLFSAISVLKAGSTGWFNQSNREPRIPDRSQQVIGLVMLMTRLRWGEPVVAQFSAKWLNNALLTHLIN